MANQKLGFLGLGIMGKPMCKNLLQAGYPVTVWNRSQSGINECVKCGAFAAHSAREVAEKSDIVITMVPTSIDVWQIVTGPNGIVEGARSGMILIDMSSISPKTAKEISDRLIDKGIKMLDAPVSGNESGAISGTLSIMVGGLHDAFDQCLPILKVLGKTITHCGEENGNGQKTKLCNQVIGCLNNLAMCEGFVLAAKLGLDMDKMLAAVRAGGAGSRALDEFGPMILKRNLEPGFFVKHFQKDLRMVLETADELKTPLPGTALVHQLYSAVEADGLSLKGEQALIHALEKMAGIIVMSGPRPAIKSHS